MLHRRPKLQHTRARNSFWDLWVNRMAGDLRRAVYAARAASNAFDAYAQDPHLFSRPKRPATKSPP